VRASVGIENQSVQRTATPPADSAHAFEGVLAQMTRGSRPRCAGPVLDLVPSVRLVTNGVSPVPWHGKHRVNDVTSASRESPLLVVLVLLLPALFVGGLFAAAVRRHPGLDPASPRPANALAHRLERRGVRLPPHFDPRTETGLLLTLGLAVIAIGGVVLGSLGLLVRSDSGLLRIDRSIEPWGEDHMTELSRWLVDRVTSLGGTPVLVVATVVVLVVEMLRRPSRWLPVFVIAVTAGQMLLSISIKDLVDRVRPAVNPVAQSLGPSFPSGHTTGAAACYAAFALVLGRGRTRNTQAVLAGAAVCVAVAVAASRVLLGVHWLTDVIGGLALGWAWFALCSIAFGGRLLRLGAPIEAATRVSEAAARSARPPPAPPPDLRDRA
jgi:undecaprenyl-diphosphatase